MSACLMPVSEKLRRYRSPILEQQTSVLQPGLNELDSFLLAFAETHTVFEWRLRDDGLLRGWSRQLMMLGCPITAVLWKRARLLFRPHGFTFADVEPLCLSPDTINDIVRGADDLGGLCRAQLLKAVGIS